MGEQEPHRDTQMDAEAWRAIVQDTAFQMRRLGGFIADRSRDVIGMAVAAPAFMARMIGEHEQRRDQPTHPTSRNKD